MNDLAFISVFTPSRTAPEDLEAIFVQRQAMLADAVERVHESATTGNKHHLLFVGPRGTGKTHLVTLLVHRLSQNVELKDHLRIAWLNEDETTTTLLEFLRRIYLALIKRYPDDYSEASLEAIYDLDSDAAERWLSSKLLEHLKGRTLLLVVENLDALFEGLGEPGQQRLRAFIQEHPVLSIVATAQRLGDDITKRKSVFFGFFQMESLETLSMEEATQLLINIANLNRHPEVEAFLRSPIGRSRIQALHHLSGGNHRIYIVLSQFITRDNIDSLVRPLTKMSDEMTPYYQERIRWLPPQQRKIIEYLCICNQPVPVKDLARQLFATPQTISSQLKDLRKKGYVLSAQRGRESLYEIAEPLMRLCVEVKINQSHEPMRLLVDFLRAWYDERGLSSRLEGCKDESLNHSYLQAAINRNVEAGNLRAQLLVAGFRAELGYEKSANWITRIEAYAQESEELALACGEWAKGHVAEALRLLVEIADVRGDQSASVRASACLLAAEIHLKQGAAFELVIKALDPIRNISGAPVEDVARALWTRGWFYAEHGDREKAIADYSTLIDLPDVSAELVARALNNRGVIHREIGDFESAIVDYSTAIDLADASLYPVARALLNKGETHLVLDEFEKAIADLSSFIDLPETPADLAPRAFYSRGIAHKELGDLEKAIADFSVAIDLPNAPVGWVARALYARGLAHWRLGDLEKAITDYSAVICLPNAPVEPLARAFNNRGVDLRQLGDCEKAMVDFSAAIDLPDAPVEVVSRALYNRGWTYLQMSNAEKAEQDFEAFLQLAEAPIQSKVDTYLALTEICIATGRWDFALSTLAAGLALGSTSQNVPSGSYVQTVTQRGNGAPYAGDSEAIVKTFFDSGLTPGIRRERTFQLVQIYQDHNALLSLGEALTRHLGSLCRAADGLPASDNLELWASAWEEAGKDLSVFRLPLRIFRTGINFLKSGGKDSGILLDLNQEERRILKQALAIETGGRTALPAGFSVTRLQGALGAGGVWYDQR